MRSTHDLQTKVAGDAAKSALREKRGLFMPTEAMLAQAHSFWAHVPPTSLLGCYIPGGYLPHHP
jgi:hypothetical protein